jgi:hypothetical protein
VPDFIIPCGDGYFQAAYWVKQLAEGQVAGLPQEYTPGQTPFITKVYTVPIKGQKDNMGPVHMLPYWLLAILTGPATHYGMLLKHIEVTNNWGVVGEVLCFQQLEHHLSNLCLQITHLKAEFQRVSQAQTASKGQLELAHLAYHTSDFRILSTIKPRVLRADYA